MLQQRLDFSAKLRFVPADICEISGRSLGGSSKDGVIQSFDLLPPDLVHADRILFSDESSAESDAIHSVV
jgi:hypothetical protein